MCVCVCVYVSVHVRFEIKLCLYCCIELNLHADALFSTLSGIPIPKTVLGKFPIEYEFIEKHFGYPVILKRTSGSKVIAFVPASVIT